MPSAQEIVRNYHENDWASQPWLEKYGYTSIRTRAEYVNVCFREWGHQWLYDTEELERRLREAGFSQIENVGWGESKHPELRNRETRIETLLTCEATK
jgi:predicted SAM-dependent methyltransferase